MPTLTQRLRLAWKGWNRRREEGASPPRVAQAVQPVPRGADQIVRATPAAALGTGVDLDGLQVAFLDDSGAMEHFLDLDTGEVIDFPSTDREIWGEMLRDPRRYRRVPRRSAASEATDRRLFADTVDREDIRLMLMTALHAGDASAQFRRVIARDRSVERAWFTFKNERATAAVEEWLSQLE